MRTYKQFSRFNRNPRRIYKSMRERFAEKEKYFQNQVENGEWAVDTRTEGLKRCGVYLYRQGTEPASVTFKPKTKPIKNNIKLNKKFISYL